MVLQSGQLSVAAWLDNKVVMVMATNVQPDEQGPVRRVQRDATSVEVRAPTSVIAYNKWMGGVDRGDQLRQYYHLRLKSRKFYKYIFLVFSRCMFCKHLYTPHTLRYNHQLTLQRVSSPTC